MLLPWGRQVTVLGAEGTVSLDPDPPVSVVGLWYHALN